MSFMFWAVPTRWQSGSEHSYPDTHRKYPRDAEWLCNSSFPLVISLYFFTWNLSNEWPAKQVTKELPVPVFPGQVNTWRAGCDPQSQLRSAKHTHIRDSTTWAVHWEVQSCQTAQLSLGMDLNLRPNELSSRTLPSWMFFWWKNKKKC